MQSSHQLACQSGFGICSHRTRNVDSAPLLLISEVTQACQHVSTAGPSHARPASLYEPTSDIKRTDLHPLGAENKRQRDVRLLGRGQGNGHFVAGINTERYTLDVCFCFRVASPVRRDERRLSSSSFLVSTPHCSAVFPIPWHEACAMPRNESVCSRERSCGPLCSQKRSR
jgi:hypothetical protein